MDSEKEYPRKETFALSFRVWHPTIDAQEIADSICLPAKRICRAGEPKRTPKGVPLHGVYPDNFYVGDAIGSEEFAASDFDRDLPSCIDLALQRLAPCANYLLHLKSAGAQMEFFVGWTVRGNAGLELEPALMTRLADLGIALSLDVYAKSTQAEE